MSYKTHLKGTADIWYFDKPTIGFCKCCDCIAEYSSMNGFRCPVCGENADQENISFFTWDENSPYPEQEVK